MNEDLEMYCRFSSKNEIGSREIADIQTSKDKGKRPKKDCATVRTVVPIPTAQHALCGLVRN